MTTTHLRSGRLTGKAGRCGFTLIELLVVIAIIAVLIAILLPALGSARNHGRATVCASNVRSQAMSISVYANNFRDALPPRQLDWNRNDGQGGFEDRLYLINLFMAEYNNENFLETDPWLTPTGMWRCPDVKDDQDASRWTHNGILHHAPNEWLFNYGIWNDATRGYTNWGDVYPGWEPKFQHRWRSLVDVPFPKEIIELMCNNNYYVPSHFHRDAREFYGLSSDAVVGPNPANFDNAMSHQPLLRLPAVFVDGHGEGMPATPGYWLDAQHNYRAPDGSVFPLWDREAQRYMWFLSPGERAR